MKKLLSIASIGYFLYAIGMLIFVVYRMILAINSSLSDPSFSILSTNGAPLLIFCVVGTLLSTAACWLSYLLFQRNKRKTVIVLACLLLLGFPFGTVLGVITLFLLHTQKIKAEFSQ